MNPKSSSKARQPRHFCRGRCSSFTLIELLIVVAIIAILSAVAVPNFMKVSGKARRAYLESVEAARHNAAPAARVDAVVTVPPIIEQADLSMQLTPTYRQAGMDVFTRYEAQCEGRIRFRHPDDTTAPVLLTVPLPFTAVEARDTAIEVTVGGAAEGAPKGRISRELSGLCWQGELPPGAIATAQVRYTCTGGQRFACSLPPARFLQGVNVRLEVRGDVTWTIPDSALQPTRIDGKQLAWTFGNVISDRAIEVEIPPMLSPNGRVVLLFRLLAVAVLLFGFGIWYLSEEGKPGRLAGFRFGHFLLLALTYSLFFVIFAILVLQGSIPTLVAMTISAVLSLPLLILHVSRFTDMQFAVTRVLPLAVFTLGLVINGVYGDRYRDYVYIGAVTFVVGYLTLTYRGWAHGRRQLRENRTAELRQTVLALQNKCSGELSPLADRLRQASSRMSQLVKDAAKAGETSHAYVLEGLVAESAVVLEEHQSLAKSFPAFKPHHYTADALTLGQYQREISSYERSVKDLSEQTQTLIAAIEREMHTAMQDRPAASTADGRPRHCIACGADNVTSPCCSQCGVRQPVVLSCCSCNSQMVLPVSLMDPACKDIVWHCSSCGTRNESANPATRS
jgi:prepilin-type N-terminal cleavage/methylation domain-containing protein